MSAKIIAVANHKGGVGKTVSVTNIGAILASKGKKVLLIDLDTQANLTLSFMPVIPGRLIYHAIRERANMPIYPIRENLDLVPSGLEMAGVELEIQTMFNRERVITDLIAPHINKYDYIIFDCPPSLGLVTLNALTACSKLLVPMKADLMSSYGLGLLENFCVTMQVLNPGIHIDNIFFTAYEAHQLVTDAIEEQVRKKYGDKVLKTVIRKNTDVAKAAFEHTDVCSAFPTSPGSSDYKALVDELLKNI